MAESPNFEDSLQQLNEAVRRLESGDLALEEALQAFEEGIRHSRDCHRLLQKAEERIEMILKTLRTTNKDEYKICIQELKQQYL